jgi:hypothetical protein
MKERPILCHPHEVLAILDGRQTQIRRFIKTQPKRVHGWNGPYLQTEQIFRDGRLGLLCPYGVVGDRLWVRETLVVQCGQAFRYDANGEWLHVPKQHVEFYKRYLPNRSCPSIHMPRWASRITLEITDVRVQRVQEISDDDAKAEGIEPCPYKDGSPVAIPGGCECHRMEKPLPYVCAFADLWDSINAKRGYSWDSNPWVWVLAFRKVTV